MLTGPEAWPAVAALETGWLESLWGRLGEDDAGGFQDDITAERFDEIFQEWAEEEFGPVDTKGGFGNELGQFVCAMGAERRNAWDHFATDF